MLAILNYEAGNLTSVRRALDSLGIPCTVTADHDVIARSQGIIFPGVGAAGSAMEHLRRSAMVAGIQSQGVGTSLKHFAANNQETDRLRVDAQVDERTLREVYLPAFEQVVRRCQPWTVMCSYNRINGTYASEDPWLLTEVLREQWGYEGLVVSDWGAVNERVPGLAAGLDLEMPASGGRTDAQVVAAVRSGELDESVLDAAATRVTAMILAGHATLGARTGVGSDGATAFLCGRRHTGDDQPRGNGLSRAHRIFY